MPHFPTQPVLSHGCLRVFCGFTQLDSFFWGVKGLEGLSLYLSAHGSLRWDEVLAASLALFSALASCFLFWYFIFVDVPSQRNHMHTKAKTKCINTEKDWIALSLLELDQIIWHIGIGVFVADRYNTGKIIGSFMVIKFRGKFTLVVTLDKKVFS